MGELCDGKSGRLLLFRTIEYAEQEELDHVLMPNQTAIATTQATTANNTNGAICFELPLRVQSLAA
jgi:hypothetical protein